MAVSSSHGVNLELPCCLCESLKIQRQFDKITENMWKAQGTADLKDGTLRRRWLKHARSRLGWYKGCEETV